MKEYVLNYQSQFVCLAGQCKHTCCAGWDIYLDSETLTRYKADTSSFASRLHGGIDFKKGKFRTDKAGRCAFLDGDGLCEIFTHYGKESLCEICHEHPAFRSHFEDRIETGLGFCCEQAAKIILSYPEKIEPVLLCDDQTASPLSFVSERILCFRKRALDHLQDRAKPMNDRLNALLSLCGTTLTARDYKKTLALFCRLERLDKTWSKRLAYCKKKPLSLCTDESLSFPCEQFLVNALYRHVASAEDVFSAQAITLACLLSWAVIHGIWQAERTDCTDMDCLYDVVRAFSAEVEYSQNNLDRLFALASRMLQKSV